jgi:hypothetical protein
LFYRRVPSGPPSVVDPVLAEQYQKLVGLTVPEWRFAAAEHFQKTSSLLSGPGKL